jgi:hypothetical protein
MSIALFTAFALTASAHAADAPDTTAVATSTAPERARTVEFTSHAGNIGARFMQQVTPVHTLLAEAAGGGTEGGGTVHPAIGSNVAVGVFHSDQVSFGGRAAYDATILGGARASAVTLSAPVSLRAVGKRGLTASVALGPCVTYQLEGARADMRAHTQGIALEASQGDVLGGRGGLMSEFTIGYRF